MPGLQKAGGAHHIDRAGFSKLGRTLLPQETHPFVVIDANGITTFNPLPEKVVEWHHSQRCVSFFGQQGLDGAVDILS